MFKVNDKKEENDKCGQLLSQFKNIQDFVYIDLIALYCRV